MDEAKIAEYRNAVFMAINAARVLASHDIPQLLADIERAQAIGPILDPTLWMKKQRAMEQDRELLRAAIPLHLMGKKIRETP